MRKTIKINEGWLFSKDNQSFEKINLPHTWNGIDGQDGGNDYYRGKCYYKKSLSLEDMPKGDMVYLQLDGVNSSAQVIWNNKVICTHQGGYSTFRVELPRESGELVITADNSPNDTVYPQQADFTFYGGIYRDVKLIGVSKSHFDLDYFGSSGLKITPNVNGDVELEAYGNGTIRFEIIDNDSIIAEETIHGNKVTLRINDPHLWNGTIDPYLYKARATMIDKGVETDMVEASFGFRSFEFDADKGFILNGKPYALRGVSRHQDRPKIGNALSYEHHKEDMELIAEMGANTIRLAHYQHSQDFYDLCDQYGMVVWAEIPYISKHMPKAKDNTLSQMRELIVQSYNHPSIVVWGLSNEITMGGASDKSLIDNHRELNDLCHRLDKTRPTTLAVVTMCGIDEEYVHISDIVSYNHYFGWYGGNVNMYGKWFDDFHKKYPKKPIGISEYGCEALDWHTSKPMQGDYTEEYQAYYHEELIKQIAKRPYLWATHVWNMFDFAADARAEGGENGMNHKGLVSFDRKYKKDSFYAYKAWLSNEPVLHICSKRYIDRVEEKTKITIYSNQNEIELFVNGVSQGKQTKGEYPFFYYEIDNIGESQLRAVAGVLEDTATIRKVDKPNTDYIMQIEGDVINWFEIDTPVGYLSINDTIGDILKTFGGKLVLLSIGKSLLKSKDKTSGSGVSISGFKVSKTMIELGKGFDLKRGLAMLGGKFTKDQILDINKRLNKIKKK